MLVLARHAFGPGIDLRESLAEYESLEISPALLVILQNLAADLVEANALGPFVDALKIACLLAVHLDERHDMLERIVLGLDQAENISALDIEAAAPAKWIS
jgi:hypothetical protein